MDIWSTLVQAAEVFPEKTAVVDGGARLTYRQVLGRASALALYLRRRGVLAGDRLAILEVNSHAFLEAYYAAAGLGAILCPLNHRLSPAELTRILADAGARWLLAGPGFAFAVRQVLADWGGLEGLLWLGSPPPDSFSLPASSLEEAIGESRDVLDPAGVEGGEVAQLYYTSGTTGHPKGVMLTHRNVCTHAVAAIEELALSDVDNWGHIAPMFHLADAWATFAMTWVGGCHVMARRFDAEQVLRLIERERVTITNLVPTMLNLMNLELSRGDYDMSSLRVLLSGGAPMAPDLARQIMDSFGCDYVQTYGMTETSPYLALSLLKPHLQTLTPDEQFVYKAKTGRPFAAVELMVVSPGGGPVRPDGQEVGEIWARGPTVTPGYWNRPEETASAFHEGWLRTGDLATLDAEGYVNIVDRLKDMILSGGENVYSIEVENVLVAHPKVLEAAVYGVPDETWGETVTASVVLRDNQVATEREIIDFARQRLAPFKAPKSVEFLPELPRTGSGKIHKNALRERRGERR